eukprot:TRINITY_DN29142_c0_g1_i1.p1 TRINITY_DN29142_c0_g1~~TRINITY_DN29142_c0_g1_i1.p1  ORF type:complete len:107 (-),score=18.67 TRINITY_DN29142_c0_g1_i1:10-297(-)
MDEDYANDDSVHVYTREWSQQSDTKTYVEEEFQERHEAVIQLREQSDALQARVRKQQYVIEENTQQLKELQQQLQDLKAEQTRVLERGVEFQVQR